jgi:hypothetical protein
MDWKQLLASITGSVDEELLLRNEYLVTENRILRQQIPGRVRLSDGERKTLAELGKKLGRQALAEVATIVKPDTILGWHRTLVAQKSHDLKPRKSLGRPRIDQEIEALVVRMARENRRWGYAASQVPWPTWTITSVTKRWATSSGATVFQRPRSARRPRPGRSSSVSTWTCWGLRTSSAARYGIGLDWSSLACS